MPSPVLTTLADCKAYLGVTGTSEDAVLTELIVGIEETIAQASGRQRVPGRNPFESVAATEYYDGPGRPTLVLRRRPVTVVSAVKVDQAGYYGQGPQAFPSGSAWTVGEHYAVPRLDASEQNGGMLISLGGCWPLGTGNVLVTYTAGYATIPDDLTLLVHMLANIMYRGLKRGGPIVGETFGKYSYRLLTDSVSKSTDIITARSILSRYTE